MSLPMLMVVAVLTSPPQAARTSAAALARADLTPVRNDTVAAAAMPEQARKLPFAFFCVCT